ncbi:MAG: YlxR family protein [Clostridia bacterium]|nr:YlxR family protein [Clostridia bacterium]
MKSVHEPVRECISCGRKLAKRELVRVVKNQEGIFLDMTGKADGRGAYLCGSLPCVEKLVKQRRLNRAFRGSVSPEVYEKIEAQLVLLGAGQKNPEV